MIRLEDEPVGKIRDIDILSFFPHRIGLSDMFLADALSNPRLNSVLVNKDVVERIAVMNFEPLKFFVIRFRAFQVELSSDSTSVHCLQM